MKTERKKPISKGQCENLPVTVTLSAIDLRWLVNGFHCSQREYCRPGTQRWNEGEQLVEKLRKEINSQVEYEFAYGAGERT